MGGKAEGMELLVPPLVQGRETAGTQPCLTTLLCTQTSQVPRLWLSLWEPLWAVHAFRRHEIGLPWARSPSSWSPRAAGGCPQIPSTGQQGNKAQTGELAGARVPVGPRSVH